MRRNSLGSLLFYMGCLICGWITRLRKLFHPIANVLAPIPSIVFALMKARLIPARYPKKG